MDIESLLTRLEARTPGTPAKIDDVPVKPACLLTYTPRTPRTPQKQLTQDEKLLELNSLIEYVAAGNNFSAEDIIEAKHYANKDLENALTSFRALARDIRRDKAMELLQASPESLRAIHIDSDSDPENIILTTALRHVAIFEMFMSRSRYDSWKMINILDGEVH